MTDPEATPDEARKAYNKAIQSIQRAHPWAQKDPETAKKHEEAFRLLYSLRGSTVHEMRHGGDQP